MGPSGRPQGIQSRGPLRLITEGRHHPQPRLRG